ncbi:MULTISPECIES: asparagine synthetase B family protein [Sphingomonas]|uniref:asparagine synthase-related protein n=1 Tax=Sphingomonas TaxID=13687 RepID=UPI000DEF8126|nr:MULTISPECIES: asparagine synthetase B family protein [Sphingomonas]
MIFAGAVDWRSLAAADDTRPAVWFSGRLDDVAAFAVSIGANAAIPPAELIGLAVARRGIAILDTLYGEFALAVVEPKSRQLHLMRDATGQRPLLFVSDSHGVRFGSAPRDLGLALRPDLAGLAAFLDGHAALQEGTALAGVRQVRPGEIVTIAPERLTRRYWWQPIAEPEPFDPRRDYAEEYRAHLAEAVRLRLPSGPVATHLSAGWDSGAVTSAAAALAGPDRVTAFTAVPWRPVEGAIMRHADPDESPLAALTANHLGIHHRLLREKSDPFANARAFIADAQAPLPDAFHLGWWNAARDAARGVGATVLLTGELGNLSLNASGLPMLRWLVTRGHYRQAWRESAALVAAGTVRRRGAAATALAHCIPAPLFDWARTTFGGGIPSTAGGFLRPKRRRVTPPTAPGGNPHADRLAQIRASDFGTFRHLSQQRWGLAETDPTADRRLVEWSLRLPSETLLNDGVLRPMARRALHGRLPDAVLASPLRGLQSADWYQQAGAVDCRRLLAEIREHSLARDFLDIAAIEQAIDNWPTGDWNSPAVYGRYRVSLFDALCAGLFIAHFAP